MRKSTVVLAIALGFSIISLNATNEINLSSLELNEKTVEVSPICKAAAVGDIQQLKMLINNGVDINKKSNGMLPIHYAAKYNRVDVIKILITAGSEIHAKCDLGYTALAHAKKSNANDAALFLKRFKNKNV